MSVSKKSWGYTTNSPAFSAKIVDDVNKTIHSSTFFNQGTFDEFALMNILLSELVGTYKFKSEDDFLLDNENLFWWNLMYYGRVAVWERPNGRKCIMRLTNTEYEYGELVSARISTARIDFSQKAMTDKKPETSIEIKGKNLDKLVVIVNDVASQFFMVKYGWIIKDTLDIYNKYQSSNQMKVKKLSIHSNTKNESVLKSFYESMQDNTSFIEFQNPQLVGDIMTDPSVAMEKAFTLEQLDFPEGSYITLADVIRQLKFGKDIIGMNENAGDTKERVISTEIETAEINTLQIEEGQMRNYRKFNRDMKTKFGIIVEITKTKDELAKIENSEQAFTQSKGENDE